MSTSSEYRGHKFNQKSVYNIMKTELETFDYCKRNYAPYEEKDKSGLPEF